MSVYIGKVFIVVSLGGGLFIVVSLHREGVHSCQFTSGGCSSLSVYIGRLFIVVSLHREVVHSCQFTSGGC